MRVLFALNNDNISNSIIRKYQKDYKEVLSYKNVYYFNAIVKELQKDKTYDAVVINEDLEPFASNDYDTIDKFIFEKLDKISDEATNAKGEDIPIILICTDRRNKGDDILVRFFGLGIYNAILGSDRQIDQVCRLINQPRTKKEAKVYYKIETYDVSYQSEKENSVDETEVQNILAHYKKLGKDEEKYVSSFNTIAEQYTDAQLRVIIRYLPMNVKAVLEEQSPKYQSLVTFNDKDAAKQERRAIKTKNKIDVKMLNNESDKPKINKPIVIPQNLSSKKIRKIETNINGKVSKIEEKPEEVKPQSLPENVEQEDLDLDTIGIVEEKPAEIRRGRGRPRKTIPEVEIPEITVAKRGRGRPKKEISAADGQEKEENQEEQEETIDLLELLDNVENTPDEPTEVEQSNNIADDSEENDTIDLFNIGFSEDEENEGNHENQEPIVDNEDEESLNDEEDILDIDYEEENSNNEEVTDNKEEPEDEAIDLFNISGEENSSDNIEEEKIRNEDLLNIRHKKQETEEPRLFTGNKKVVCFVGTTKNGTSFIVNNLAEVLSNMGISTAILDMTTNRNAYYIYTNNNEELRNIAINSFEKLNSNTAKGIKINKNLTVYTALPGDDHSDIDIGTMISTLTDNHEAILIDCDFETSKEVFEKSQEIYLVQTQDVLTIQPLTAFLRDLKARNILEQEKIRIVINKEQHLKTLSDKILIGGIAYYNDPAMSFMTELFNKDNVKYCKIPFDSKNYEKYLNSLVECSISLNGYTKDLLTALHELAEMVYPLLSKPKYSPRGKKTKEVFSNEVNNTLDKMKNNY